jgi:hypothetical protein
LLVWLLGMLWFPPRWLKIRRPFLAVVLQGIFDVVLTPSHPFQKKAPGPSHSELLRGGAPPTSLCLPCFYLAEDKRF